MFIYNKVEFVCLVKLGGAALADRNPELESLTDFFQF